MEFGCAVQISVTTEPTSLTILELQQSRRHRLALSSSAYILALNAECHILPAAGSYLKFDTISLIPLPLAMQGEELRKQIGAAAYIECSSKTQQVVMTHVQRF